MAAAKGKSKIDQMGIGARVLELRKTLTCEEVADIVNQKYLPAGVEPITHKTVSRYCINHGMLDMERHDLKSMRFDVLEESMRNRKRLVRHADKLERLVTECKEDEEKLSELASISNAYLNAVKELQKLDESVSKMQAEQLKLEKIRVCMKTLITILGKYPLVKAEFFQRLQEDDNFDMIRSL